MRETLWQSLLLELVKQMDWQHVVQYNKAEVMWDLIMMMALKDLVQLEAVQQQSWSDENC